MKDYKLIYIIWLYQEGRQSPVFIFITSEPGKLWKLADSAKKLNKVKMAYVVTEIFNIIVYTELRHMKELRELIDDLHLLDGVVSTRTAVTVPPRVEGEH